MRIVEMENKTVVIALTSSVELANEIVAEIGIPLEAYVKLSIFVVWTAFCV